MPRYPTHVVTPKLMFLAVLYLVCPHISGFTLIYIFKNRLYAKILAW